MTTAPVNQKLPYNQSATVLKMPNNTNAAVYPKRNTDAPASPCNPGLPNVSQSGRETQGKEAGCLRKAVVSAALLMTTTTELDICKVCHHKVACITLIGAVNYRSGHAQILDEGDICSTYYKILQSLPKGYKI